MIAAADNYLDADLRPFVALTSDAPQAIINAYQDLEDPTLVRRRFGVVDLSHEAGRIWATSFEEKPANPSSTIASLGFYIFPLKRFHEFPTYVVDHERPHMPARGARSAPLNLGGAGSFLEWYIKSKEYHSRRHPRPQDDERVRMWCLKGRWGDVGTPSSLLEHTIVFVHDLIERPRSARELEVAGTTRHLTDRYYFLAKRMSIRHAKDQRVVDIFIQPDDPICSSNADACDGVRVLSLEAVKDQGARQQFWHRLSKRNDTRDLAEPVLISGGVFLFDSPLEKGLFGHADALIPLLVRDFAARVDAGRSTTAAGRLDSLDLEQVCFSELAEEMVFYGSEASDRATQIFVCGPQRLAWLLKRIALERVRNHAGTIPGLDRRRVDMELRGKGVVTKLVPVQYLLPPMSHRATVRIFYDNNLDPRHELKNCVFVPDQDAATLEFRVACAASICERHPNAPLQISEQDGIGRVHGILDGDGHGRTTLLARAKSLSEYARRIEGLSAQTLLDPNEPKDLGVDVLAVGRGSDGLFVRFNQRWTIMPVTRSLLELTQFYDRLRVIDMG